MKLRNRVVGVLIVTLSIAGSIQAAGRRQKNTTSSRQQPTCDKILHGTKEESFVQRTSCARQAMAQGNTAKAIELMAPVYKHAKTSKSITARDSKDKLGAIVRTRLGDNAQSLLKKYKVEDVYVAVALVDDVDPESGKTGVNAKKLKQYAVSEGLLDKVKQFSPKWHGPAPERGEYEEPKWHGPAPQEGSAQSLIIPADLIRNEGIKPTVATIEGRPAAPSRPAPTKKAATSAQLPNLPLIKQQALSASDKNAMVDLLKQEILDLAFDTIFTTLYLQALKTQHYGICFMLIEALKEGNELDLKMLLGFTSLFYQKGAEGAVATVQEQEKNGTVEWRKTAFEKGEALKGEPVQKAADFFIPAWTSFTPALSVTSALREKGILHPELVKDIGEYVQNQEPNRITQACSYADLVNQLRAIRRLFNTSITGPLQGIEFKQKNEELNKAIIALTKKLVDSNKDDLRQELVPYKKLITRWSAKALEASAPQQQNPVAYSKLNTALKYGGYALGLTGLAIATYYLGRDTAVAQTVFDDASALMNYVTQQGANLLGYLGSYGAAIQSMTTLGVPSFATLRKTAGIAISVTTTAQALVSGVKNLQAGNYKQASWSGLFLITTGGFAYNSLATLWNTLNEQRQGYLAARALGDGLQRLAEQGEQIQAAQAVFSGLEALRQAGQEIRQQQEAAQAVFEGLQALKEAGQEAVALQAERAMRAGINEAIHRENLRALERLEQAGLGEKYYQRGYTEASGQAQQVAEQVARRHEQEVAIAEQAGHTQAQREFLPLLSEEAKRQQQLKEEIQQITQQLETTQQELAAEEQFSAKQREQLQQMLAEKQQEQQELAAQYTQDLKKAQQQLQEKANKLEQQLATTQQMSAERKQLQQQLEDTRKLQQEFSERHALERARTQQEQFDRGYAQARADYQRQLSEEAAQKAVAEAAQKAQQAQQQAEQETQREATDPYAGVAELLQFTGGR